VKSKQKYNLKTLICANIRLLLRHHIRLLFIFFRPTHGYLTGQVIPLLTRINKAGHNKCQIVNQLEITTPSDSNTLFALSKTSISFRFNSALFKTTRLRLVVFHNASFQLKKISFLVQKLLVVLILLSMHLAAIPTYEPSGEFSGQTPN